MVLFDVQNSFGEVLGLLTANVTVNDNFSSTDNINNNLLSPEKVRPDQRQALQRSASVEQKEKLGNKKTGSYSGPKSKCIPESERNITQIEFRAHI